MAQSHSEYLREIEAFKQLPYLQEEFSGRNWGDKLHSLCSYQGKLKPAVAHFLISGFTQSGETVLDPMSGAGTIPLEARLQGRKGIANDLQELGFILSLAKSASPDMALLTRRFEEFLSFIESNVAPTSMEIREASNFGLNGKVSEYFHPNNLREVVLARRFILSNPPIDPESALVYACFLHILHGNRPYALSRNSHPVTPFRPTGDYEYRALRTRLAAKLERATESARTQQHQASVTGAAHLGPFEKLTLQDPVDAVITSPPFAASTRFYVANWMRLWVSGWDAADFSLKKEDFLEEKQKSGFGVYEQFFSASEKWLKPGGKLILHLGKTKKFDMAMEIKPYLTAGLEFVDLFDEEVSRVSSFGIRDQGATFAHQFMFLQKN